jgi:hypothetical protein
VASLLCPGPRSLQFSLLWLSDTLTPCVHQFHLFLIAAETGRLAGGCPWLPVVLPSCARSDEMILSFASNCPVSVALVMVSVDNRSLSAVAAMARLANASAVSL